MNHSSQKEETTSSMAVIAMVATLALLGVIGVTVTLFLSAEATATTKCYNNYAGYTATIMGKENNNDVLQGTEGKTMS